MYACRSSSTPRGRPIRPGFTLIELLIVVALIALLMSVLIPAVFAAMKQVKNMTGRELISRLSTAIHTYADDYSGIAPAIVADPTDTATNPGGIRLTGAQNLRLALIGCSLSGGTLTPRGAGSAEDISNYNGSAKRVYFEPKAGQMVAHGSLARKAADGTAADIEVFTDATFTPARPILYYRQRNGSFHFSDNQTYCQGTGETEATWNLLATQATAAKERFFLVWCAGDRDFFTRDDYSSLRDPPELP